MKFREFITSSGVIVFGGKNAENNEELISQVGSEEVVLHTKESGSPFVNLKGIKPTTRDISEASVFCAKYSQDWRDNKLDVFVHKFYGKDIYKNKEMKTGTFGVKKFKIIKVKKENIEKFSSL